MRRVAHTLACALAVALAACTRAPHTAGTAHAPATPSGDGSAFVASPPLVAAARRQVGRTIHYDPAYVRLAYPGGDVPADRGVCTDVIVRALRTQGIDLQGEIHVWRTAPGAAHGIVADRNIDHRRVPNQMAWFAARGWGRPITGDPRDYAAGDIVAWRLRDGALLHIGIVSDRRSSDGVPRILHNIGSGTREEPFLFEHPVIGHYRPLLPSTVAARR